MFQPLRSFGLVGLPGRRPRRRLRRRLRTGSCVDRQTALQLDSEGGGFNRPLELLLRRHGPARDVHLLDMFANRRQPLHLSLDPVHRIAPDAVGESYPSLHRRDHHHLTHLVGHDGI